MKKHLISFTALLFALTTMPGFVAIGAPEYSGLGTCDQMSNEALSCSIERMRMITNTTKCAGKNNLSTLQNYADIQFRNKAKQDGIDTLTSKDKDLKKFIEKHKNNVLTAVKEYCGKFIIPSSSKSSTTATAQTNKCEGNLIWVESMNACQSPNVAKANLEFDKKLKECQDGGATGYSQTKGCLCPDEKTQEWNGKKCVQKCPWDATGTYPNCNCNSGVHEVPTNSSSHYIQYNSKEGRNQCDEWIELLDSDCIHKGHAPEIRNYNNQNIPQKGKCLVFGDTEETRIQVRTLVRNYNNEIKKKRALPTGTNNAIVFGNKSEVYKWEGLDGKEGQPSIKAIVRGYTALCKRNGDGFNFVRVEQGNTTSYVCQGKKQEDAKSTTSQQPEQKTSQSNQNSLISPDSEISNNDATVCANPDQSGKICVYDLTDDKNKAYPFDVKAPKNRQKDIKTIVHEYNQIAMQRNFVLPISDIVAIVDKKMKNASPYRNTLEKEDSIKAVIRGYKTLCERNINYNGVTAVDFTFKTIGYGYICRAKACNESSHTYDDKQHTCVSKPSSSRQSAQLQPNTEQTPQPLPKWEPDFAPAELGNHIEFSQEHANDPIVIDWIANANNAIINADGTNKVVQETTPDGQIKYTCIITTCKNGKAPVAGGTACPETIDSLKAETQGIDVASGPSANVELKQPTQEKICANQYPSDTMGQACCKAGGKWNTEKQICTCPKQSSGYFFDKQKLQCILDDDTDEEEIEEHDIVASEPKSYELTPDGETLVMPPVPNEDGEQESQENICDDQNDEIEYLIEEMATPKTDENGNKYIEYSIKYTTCDVLETKWSEHCADNETAKVTRNAEKVILTCEPNQESNDEQDIEKIINAFKDRAKQIKDRECNSQG